MDILVNALMQESLIDLHPVHRRRALTALQIQVKSAWQRAGEVEKSLQIAQEVVVDQLENQAAASHTKHVEQLLRQKQRSKKEVNKVRSLIRAEVKAVVDSAEQLKYVPLTVDVLLHVKIHSAVREAYAR